MNQILSIFLPAVLAMYLYQRINKKEINTQECIIKYFTFVLIINTASHLISVYIFGNLDFVFNSVFTVKYLCLSSFLGVVASFVISFLEENLEINIRTDKKWKKE